MFQLFIFTSIIAIFVVYVVYRQSQKSQKLLEIAKSNSILQQIDEISKTNNLEDAQIAKINLLVSSILTSDKLDKVQLGNLNNRVEELSNEFQMDKSELASIISTALSRAENDFKSRLLDHEEASKTDLTSIQTRLGNIENFSAILSARLDTSMQSTSTRDSQLDNIRTVVIPAMNSRLEGIATSIDNISQQLNTSYSSVPMVVDRLNILSSDLNILKSRVTQLQSDSENEITQLRADITQLRTDVTQLQNSH